MLLKKDISALPKKEVIILGGRAKILPQTLTIFHFK